MPPMATSSSKRKWSDVFGDREIYDKQSIMDLCTSKLRYVNPARPPRRRTEVPLLRNVLIVNTMKHLSAEMKIEKPMEYSSEDLSVDPGHFEGLPPLSELLTDIMLDPQPNDQQQQQAAASFGWTGTVGSSYSSLTPLEPSISSYMDATDSSTELGEEKIVHDLLPCTSVVGIDQIQHPWSSPTDSLQHSSTWQVPNTSCHHHHSPAWIVSNDSSVLDCFLSSASLQPSPSDSVDALTSDLAFQSSSGPLPAFSSLFESPQNPSFTELLQTSTLPGPSSAFTSTSSCFTGSSSLSPPPAINSASADDIVGNVNLTESELEFLAMTFSTKLPLSFEDLVHALPQSSLLQQTSQPSQTFGVPSSLQGSVSASCDSASNAISQCASYCRSDQSPASVDDSGMVRVLVNL